MTLYNLCARQNLIFTRNDNILKSGFFKEQTGFQEIATIINPINPKL